MARFSSLISTIGECSLTILDNDKHFIYILYKKMSLSYTDVRLHKGCQIGYCRKNKTAKFCSK